MSIAFQCDICGKLFEGRSDARIGRPIIRTLDEGEGPFHRNYALHVMPNAGQSDLCDSCKLSICREALQDTIP